MQRSDRSLADYERDLLELIESRKEEVLCDGTIVKRLHDRGLVERGDMGWRISPTGRMLLHMHD